MSARQLTIAIDGPSGAGKGTVARTLAEYLGYRYVDTGAMYRAVAWKARQDGVNLESGEAVAAVADRAEIVLDPIVKVDGMDVTRAIRTPEIDAAATIVARHPAVRAVLVARQREYGHGGGIVMEGRDIGSVVFPSADVKFFLDAKPEERARRRSVDPAHSSSSGEDVQGVAAALEARDRSDRTRATSPLVVAPDAIYIDTTPLAAAEVVSKVLAIVKGVLDKETIGH